MLQKGCSKKLDSASSNAVSNAGCLTCLCCAAVRVNETDTFADEEGLNDEYFDFEDISGMVLFACSAYPCCWAHFLTSCVLLQRSSSTMNTSCIASEEWSASALFKLSTSLSAAVLLTCLTFWSAFDSRCYVFECCVGQLCVCLCKPAHYTLV